MPAHRLTVGHLGEMVRFALVGGSGFFVNLVAFVVIHKLLPADPQDVLVPLWPTDFNIRWIHAFSFFSFVVANLWNFELNRVWTFRAGERTSRTRFTRFFLVGLLAQLIGSVILTLLTNPYSPLVLDPAFFDGSSGLRTQSYWAQLIMIVCVTPLSFLFNRLWTFGDSRVRSTSAVPAGRRAGTTRDAAYDRAEDVA